MSESQSTNSVEKSLGLLEYLAQKANPVALREITASCAISKPTACRLLQVLQNLGYVSRPAGTRDYMIGPRAERLTAVDPQARLKAAIRPLLVSLHEMFNETVNLGILSRDSVSYLDFIETTHPLRFITTPGQQSPFACTALGRAIASAMEESEINALVSLAKIPALTPATVRSRDELRRRILEARQKGYAEESGESVEGVECLAVSLASAGFRDAAISMAVPSQRLDPKKRKAIIAALKDLPLKTRK
jgi:DNA-binding IclR family transcriptional regulator